MAQRPKDLLSHPAQEEKPTLALFLKKEEKEKKNLDSEMLELPFNPNLDFSQFTHKFSYNLVLHFNHILKIGSVMIQELFFINLALKCPVFIFLSKKYTPLLSRYEDTRLSVLIFELFFFGCVNYNMNTQKLRNLCITNFI